MSTNENRQELSLSPRGSTMAFCAAWLTTIATSSGVGFLAYASREKDTATRALHDLAGEDPSQALNLTESAEVWGMLASAAEKGTTTGLIVSAGIAVGAYVLRQCEDSARSSARN
jgi:hypothetical protein